jgi:hypothetical protein
MKGETQTSGMIQAASSHRRSPVHESLGRTREAKNQTSAAGSDALRRCARCLLTIRSLSPFFTQQLALCNRKEKKLVATCRIRLESIGYAFSQLEGPESSRRRTHAAKALRSRLGAARGVGGGFLCCNGRVRGIGERNRERISRDDDLLETHGSRSEPNS